RLWQSIVSVWAWLVLVVCIVLWLPIMAVLRLVTAPFDGGRYTVGYFFRQIPVVVAALNPLWRFRCTGTMPVDPRRPYVVVSNHESVVHGTSTALRKHDWRFGRSTAVVRVLEPIETTGLTPADVPALKDRVRKLIVDSLSELAAGRLDPPTI